MRMAHVVIILLRFFLERFGLSVKQKFSKRRYIYVQKITTYLFKYFYFCLCTPFLVLLGTCRFSVFKLQ